MMERAPIAYVAHTDRAIFLLDSEGICRDVLPGPLPPRPYSTELQEQDATERCLGAQYVASIDPKTQGGLVELPRVGIPMLFAIADPRGRISLIRTAPVLKFESRFEPGSEFPSAEATVPIPAMAPPRARAGRPESFPDDDDTGAEVRTNVFPDSMPPATLREEPPRAVETPRPLPITPNPYSSPVPVGYVAGRRAELKVPPPFPRSPRQLANDSRVRQHSPEAFATGGPRQKIV